LLSWLKSLLLRRNQRKALEQIRAINAHVRSGSDDENSMFLLSASLAAKHLQKIEHGEFKFPSSELHGHADLRDPKTVMYLTAYNVALREHHTRLTQSDKPMARLIAPGYLIFIHSIRGLLYPPPMLAEARELWTHICRGLPYFPQTYREFVNSEETETVIWDTIFLPAFLFPDSVVNEYIEPIVFNRLGYGSS